MTYVTASMQNRAALLAAGRHCHSMGLSIWVLIRQGLRCLPAKAPPPTRIHLDLLPYTEMTRARVQAAHSLGLEMTVSFKEH